MKEGDLQWMTAGKGIVHSEMPGSFEGLNNISIFLRIIFKY